MNNQYDINIENSRDNNLNNLNNINQNPYINQDNIINQGFNQGLNQGNNQIGPKKAGFNQGDFIKGALIGAAVTYLLTNKGAQENIMKAASKGSELFQAGMEEIKERYEDARAQMEAK